MVGLIGLLLLMIQLMLLLMLLLMVVLLMLLLMVLLMVAMILKMMAVLVMVMQSFSRLNFLGLCCKKQWLRKGLGHEMDWSFVDIHKIGLYLNMGRTRFVKNSFRCLCFGKKNYFIFLNANPTPPDHFIHLYLVYIFLLIIILLLGISFIVLLHLYLLDKVQNYLRREF